jgi:hypothetical protein
MNHPLFGEIGWQAGMNSWTGQVLIDFFARYDTSVVSLCADRLGLPPVQTALVTRFPPGVFELRVINRAGGEPSQEQQRAFLQFMRRQNSICKVVVQAVFEHYQGHWGSWRGTVEPGKEKEYTDDILIPELFTPADLEQVIRLDALHVLDFPTSGEAYLGFCFDCSWDPEHGLGVLVHGGKVIELGENDITWSAPEFAVQRSLWKPATKPQLDEQRGIAGIKRLGGNVTEEDRQTGRLKINLRSKPIHDSALQLIGLLANVWQLDLAHTPITSAGLAELRGLDKLEDLDLSGTAITDAGLNELRAIKNLKKLKLSQTAVTNVGMKHLRDRKTLVLLHLGGTAVSDLGVQELRGLPNLQSLDLAGARVTDAGLQALQGLKSLMSLNLSFTEVTGAGLQLFPSLLYLELQGTRVSDAGFRELKACKSLRQLHAGRTAVTDAGLLHLKDLTSLRTLNLEGAAVTDAGVADLRAALPRLQVVR